MTVKARNRCVRLLCNKKLVYATAPPYLINTTRHVAAKCLRVAPNPTNPASL